MAIVRRETAPTRYRDPFALARDLFAWDPFSDNRGANAFAPAFEVKETADAFVKERFWQPEYLRTVPATPGSAPAAT